MNIYNDAALERSILEHPFVLFVIEQAGKHKNNTVAVFASGLSNGLRLGAKDETRILFCGPGAGINSSKVKSQCRGGRRDEEADGHGTSGFRDCGSWTTGFAMDSEHIKQSWNKENFVVRKAEGSI